MTENLPAKVVFDLEMSESPSQVVSPNAQIQVVAASDGLNRATLATARSCLDQLESIQQTFHQIAMNLPGVARAVAEKVLEDNELVQQRAVSFVERAVRFLNAEECQVHVHPDCLSNVAQSFPEEPARSIRWLPEQSIRPGDCRVMVGSVGVEARLIDLLDSIQESLIQEATL